MLICGECIASILKLCGYLDGRNDSSIQQEQEIEDQESYLSPHYPSQFMHKEEISNSCRMMLLSLPIEHITKYYGSFNIRQIHRFLFESCQIRWKALHQQISEQRYGSFSDPNSSFNSSKKLLLILDMDETILSTRDVLFDENYAQANYSLIRYQNQHDLKFNFARISSENRNTNTFSIYAPYLMRLIWDTQHCDNNHKQQIDIGIYTHSVDDNAIYQIIFIESYYNFIHQMQYNSTKTFPI